MRKSKEVVLIDDGVERHFVITQMSASKQERWINKMIVMLSKADIKNMGAIVGDLKENNIERMFQLLSGIKYEDVEPLYNQLLECVEYIPDISNKNFKQPLNEQVIDSIITEVKNLYTLRGESLKLNFSFFEQEATSQTSEQEEAKPSITITKNTSTSQVKPQ